MGQFTKNGEVIRGCDSEQAREAKNLAGLPMLEKWAAKLRPEL